MKEQEAETFSSFLFFFSPIKFFHPLEKYEILEYKGLGCEKIQKNLLQRRRLFVKNSDYDINCSFTLGKRYLKCLFLKKEKPSERN